MPCYTITLLFYMICTWDLNHWNQLSNPLHLIPKSPQLQIGTNTLQWHSLTINTFIGPVFTMEELAFHIINTFTFDEVRSEHEQTIEYLINLRAPSHGHDCTKFSQMQAPNYTNVFLHNARYLSLYTVKVLLLTEQQER